jgi:hypothetical protein
MGIAALAAIIVLAAGCGGSASGPLTPAGAQTIGEDAVRDGDAGGAGGIPAQEPAPDLTGVGTGTTTEFIDAARADLLVIKTGWLELQVRAVEAAVTAATARVAALDGYVSGSEQTGDGENVTATVTFRIPADRWEDALEAMRSLAIKVVAERTGTEDVTALVVDLRARIANLQATESALQEIMARATKISDVLEVQAELTRVRGEIEAATAQRQHFEEQAAFSTLTVHFGLEPEPAVVVSQKKFDPGSEVDRATASLVEVLQGLATAGIWFGIVWLPILIALGLVALVAALLVRRRSRRRTGPGAPGPLGDVGMPPGAPMHAIEPGPPPVPS